MARKPQGVVPHEYHEQCTLAAHLDSLDLLWFHPPNEGLRHPAVGRRLQLAGLKRGVPDVMVMTPPPTDPTKIGTAIELKRLKGGSVSKDQRKWLKGLEALGWSCHVCKGHKEAEAVLAQLGYAPRERR